MHEIKTVWWLASEKKIPNKGEKSAHFESCGQNRKKFGIYQELKTTQKNAIWLVVQGLATVKSEEKRRCENATQSFAGVEH